MKWVMIGVGSLAGLVGLVILIGALLPRDHLAAVTATIAAPADKVWLALTDVAAYSSWRSELKQVDILSKPPAATSWRETTGQGKLTFVIEVSEPRQRLVSRIVDEGEPFGGTWEYLLEPDASNPLRTRVTITERGWVSNPVFRFVGHYFIGYHSALEGVLRALGRHFGAEASPVRAAAPFSVILRFEIRDSTTGFERALGKDLVIRLTNEGLPGWSASVTSRSDSGDNLLYQSRQLHGPHASQLFAWSGREGMFPDERILPIYGYPYQLRLRLINATTSVRDREAVFETGVVEVAWRNSAIVRRDPIAR